MTSNVDCFFERAGFDRRSIGQIHGSVGQWQCGGVPTGQRYPLLAKERCSDQLFPPPACVGTTVDNMDFKGDIPRCIHCKQGFARPNIYLFGDGNRFVDDETITRSQGYRQFTERVTKSLKDSSELSLVVIEIGCGLRVPSIRKRCEEIHNACPLAQSTLIRINLDFPGSNILAPRSDSDSSTIFAAGEKDTTTVNIQGTALQTLEHIQVQIASMDLATRGRGI